MRISKRMINVITGLLIQKYKKSKIHSRVRSIILTKYSQKFQTLQSVYRCVFAMDHNHRPLVAIKKNTSAHLCWLHFSDPEATFVLLYWYGYSYTHLRYTALTLHLLPKLFICKKWQHAASRTPNNRTLQRRISLRPTKISYALL